MDLEPARSVPYLELLDRIDGNDRRRGHLRHHLAIRPSELQRPILKALELVAFLVHRAMVPPAEQRQVRERRGATLRPVLHVMPLPDPDVAAGEAAASVSLL